MLNGRALWETYYVRLDQETGVLTQAKITLSQVPRLGFPDVILDPVVQLVGRPVPKRIVLTLRNLVSPQADGRLEAASALAVIRINDQATACDRQIADRGGLVVHGSAPRRCS